MGTVTSRRSTGVEEVHVPTSNAYRYPPKSGPYFGSHFFMGGERFDTIHPECYLFGENQDLNFLGNRPQPFPYPASQSWEPTKTVQSLVNIRKDTLKFVKVKDEHVRPGEEETIKYGIEFTFDSDVDVSITIHYFATEDIVDGQLVYHARDPTMSSQPFTYNRCANKTFSQPIHNIDPSQFTDEEWQFDPDKGYYPVVIHCIVDDRDSHGVPHSHVTFGHIDKNPDGVYTLKPLKQKQMVDGLCYLLQEIYGIENKNSERAKNVDEDYEDSGSECVVCMCEPRDTLVLPCRHLYLCFNCANNLRYQANNCPICRAPFKALLQIRALARRQTSSPLSSDNEETHSSHPALRGYAHVPLIEALNGSQQPPIAPTFPLQLPPEGLPPPTRPSKLVTTPEGVDQRPIRRIVIKRHNKNGNTTSDSEVEGATAGQSDSDTPEVILSAIMSDPPTPGKDSSEMYSLPLIRHTETSSLDDEEGNQDIAERYSEDIPRIRSTSIEIVDELNDRLNSPNHPVRRHTRETDVDVDIDYDREMENKLGTATQVNQNDEDIVEESLCTDDILPVEDVNFDDEVSDNEGEECKLKTYTDDRHTTVTFRPQAHTRVICNRVDDCDGENEDDNSLDVLSLPGTPVNDADRSSGSSVSSSGSNRVLLNNPLEDENSVTI